MRQVGADSNLKTRHVRAEILYLYLLPRLPRRRLLVTNEGHLCYIRNYLKMLGWGDPPMAYTLCLCWCWCVALRLEMNIPTYSIRQNGSSLLGLLTISWKKMVKYEDMRVWGYDRMRIWGYEDMRIWGYEVMSIWGYEGMRVLWGYEDMRVWGYEGMRVWGYEGMRIWGYEDMRVWGYEDMSIVGHS